MLIAKEKKNNNIAEYVLYMWQVEDTLRAMNFDMNIIEEKLISHYNQNEKIRDEIRNWYTNLILAMHDEGLQKTGHLKIITAVTDELFEMHKRLINEVKDQEYIKLAEDANPNIESFRVKLQKEEANDVEVCFFGLYGLLLLRLKKKEISKPTQDAMQTFSNLLAGLSKYYHNVENGKSEF